MANRVKRTPLYDLHVELGGKMVDFAGWEMPVQYPAGIMAEHTQCRTQAALFDVSHMGQVILTGDEVALKLESLVPAALDELRIGKARYTFFTNPDGGIMDDLIVSNAGDHLFIVVNASMRYQDVPYMRENLQGVEVIEVFDRALIAVQGPMAEDVVGTHCPEITELKFMETTLAEIDGTECRISRLGYTGEDGYEISIPEDEVDRISRLMLSHPKCAPAGLGARDSLRMEAGLCLYGNDINPSTSPIEAGLKWAIPKLRRSAGGFPGADRILNEFKNGPSRKLVGIKPSGRAPARAGVEIHDMKGNTVGAITSGGFGPTVSGPVAMGYVSLPFANEGTQIQLIIRGKPQPAEVCAMPFITPNYKR